MSPLPTSSPIKPYSDPTSESALSDQEADAARQARMRSKLDAIKQKYHWDTSRAWAYLVSEEDPDFVPEEEESSPPPRGLTPKRELDQTPQRALEDQKLDRAKRMLRDQVQSDLAIAMSEVRSQHPGLATAELMALLPSDLVAYAARVEADQWEPPKSPVYRYSGTGKKGRTFKVQALEKPKDDGLMLVYGSSGEVIDIELT